MAKSLIVPAPVDVPERKLSTYLSSIMDLFIERAKHQKTISVQYPACRESLSFLVHTLRSKIPAL